MSKFVQHMRNKHPELLPDLTYPCGICKLPIPSIYEKLAHQEKLLEEDVRVRLLLQTLPQQAPTASAHPVRAWTLRFPMRIQQQAMQNVQRLEDPSERPLS